MSSQRKRHRRHHQEGPKHIRLLPQPCYTGTTDYATNPLSISSPSLEGGAKIPTLQPQPGQPHLHLHKPGCKKGLAVNNKASTVTPSNSCHSKGFRSSVPGSGTETKYILLLYHTLLLLASRRTSSHVRTLTSLLC